MTPVEYSGKISAIRPATVPGWVEEHAGERGSGALFNWYVMGTSFVGAFVEFVEALTIILAVGTIRGWRSSLLGALTAVLILAALTGVVGAPLVGVIHLFWVQLAIGLVMLLFGIRWLRKAVLRYAGLKAMHDEEESYRKTVDRQRRAGQVRAGFDHAGFTTALSGTFLEGLEAVFIVITFGLAAGAMPSAVAGGLGALVVVTAGGLALRKPLAKVPENLMKFVVGVMLTSFGAFWIGESFHVAWPGADLTIFYLAGTLALFAWTVAAWCRGRLRKDARSTGEVA